MIALRLRLHVFNVDDFPFFVEKRDRQGKQGVSHPHAVPVAVRKDEKHSLVGAHLFPEHQTLRASFLCRRNLGIDAIKAGVQLSARHLGANLEGKNTETECEKKSD